MRWKERKPIHILFTPISKRPISFKVNSSKMSIMLLLLEKLKTKNLIKTISVDTVPVSRPCDQ